MRIKWRGLELPGHVSRDEGVSSDCYGRFTIEPFEQGFGTTIGNSMRRVLLSSLEGAAVTSIKITGVLHEFASIDGVLEDVTDIVLNVKGLVLALDSHGPKTMSVTRETSGNVVAGDIVTDPSVNIANPDHHLATLTEDVPFHMEFTVQTGRGYATAVENRHGEQEVGVITVDSVFSPVVRVRYRTEDMRVDDRTNYDRLILEVWTKGTVAPEEALVEGGLILRKHLNPFVMYHEMGDDTVAAMEADGDFLPGANPAMDELLSKPVSVLNLSVRASNCLEAAQISTLRQLVIMTPSELLRVRSFGTTSLEEVRCKLTDLNLALTKDVGEGEGAVLGQLPTDGAATVSPGDQPIGNPDAPAGTSPMEVFTMGDYPRTLNDNAT